MKSYWSALSPLLLVSLVGCGSEQFGSTPQTHKSQPDGIKQFEQLSCSSHTLIKPKVDVLYVVDNSTSTYYVANDIKTAIKNTVDSISKDFDYRLVGTALLPTPGDATPYNDYQVLTNSQDPLSSEASSRKIISSSELNFFTTPVDGAEKGLGRIVDFFNNNPGLFRQNAYTLIVLVSNGRDTDVETGSAWGNGETNINTTVYNARRDALVSIKNQLASQQLRLFSVTARTPCKTGWLSSLKSYVKMSNELYAMSGATDSNASQDSYDLCSGAISTVFAGVNSSIRKVVVPHVYRYWPITFANNNESVSLADVQVYKVSNNSAPVLMPSTTWSYYDNGSNGPLNTRELPTAGEPVAGRHFVRFNNGSLITYPDCVQVKSVSRTEYFGYIVIPKEPQPASIVVRINGQDIPQSPTNGWTYVGNRLNQNIKMPHPTTADQYPAVYKSGFMIQLNGSNNYYKSGDNVEAHYLPAGI